MAEANLKNVGTTALVNELKTRRCVEHASLIEGMFSSVSISGPVEVLMVKPETPNEDVQDGSAE